MMDGFYRMAFTGAAGSGFGILVLREGVVVGADVSGATFDGTYAKARDRQVINVDVIMSMPAGASPVQTGIPIPSPISVPIQVSISDTEILEELPKLVQTPLGPVNVILKKLRNYP